MKIKGDSDYIWGLASRSPSVLIGSKIGVSAVSTDTAAVRLCPPSPSEEEWSIVTSGGERWETLRTSRDVTVTPVQSNNYKVSSLKSSFNIRHLPRLSTFSPMDLIVSLKKQQPLWKLSQLPFVDLPLNMSTFTLVLEENTYRFETPGFSVSSKLEFCPYPVKLIFSSDTASITAVRFLRSTPAFFSLGTSSPSAFFSDEGMVFTLLKALNF